MNAAAQAETPVAIVERIAAAIRDPAATSAGLRALWNEAAELRRGMGEAESDCMKQAMDPANSVAEARTARNSAEDFAHEGRRLEASMASIDGVLPDLKAAEHRAKIMPAYLARKAAHQALVERIRKEWPSLSAKMVDLLVEIERFRQTPGVEIPAGEDPLRFDVEAEARGCDSSFWAPPYSGAGVQPIPRLNTARIPRFEPSSHEPDKLAWPRRA